MPYIDSKVTNIIDGIKVNIDLTNDVIQVYDKYVNYATFNIDSIVGCSCFISKTGNTELIVDICYFKKDIYGQHRLAILKIKYLDKELKQSESKGIELEEWIKTALSKDKKKTDFMVVDDKQTCINEIELLRCRYKFSKIVYTDIESITFMKKDDKSTVFGSPKTVFIIGELSDYNKVVNILGVDIFSYGFTTKNNLDTTLYNFFSGNSKKINYINVRNENNSFIALKKINFGLFITNNSISSFVDDIIQPKNYSYHIYGIDEDNTVSRHLKNIKGIKICIDDKSNKLNIKIPKSSAYRFNLLFPIFRNDFENLDLSTVTVICEQNGCFTTDDFYNVSNVTQFKISKNTISVY